MDDYRLIADTIADDIMAGRLKAGQRLPPQRQFARRHNIASSTAARVYSELARRGLVVGEVGRGTFVRALPRPAIPALTEPVQAYIDLELNFSVMPAQAELLSRSLVNMMRRDVLNEALRPSTVVGTPVLREAVAALMSRGGWVPDPANIVFTGNGRQAIAAAVEAIVPVGGRLGVEPLTYPVIKGIAARRGVALVPLPMDDEGLTPECADVPNLDAIYIQPTLHNPIGTTMSLLRRKELAEALEPTEIVVVEDSIYSFLAQDLPPVLPGRTIVVDSLSKRLSPGLTVGFAASSAQLTERVTTSVRTGGWAAQHFAMDVAARWLADGLVDVICEVKREDALARQEIARQHLGVTGVDPRAYHLWWDLPEPWRADTFVATAARHGIAITPGAAFAVVPGHAPNAVRVSLSAPPLETLTAALETLAQIARRDPYESWDV